MPSIDMYDGIFYYSPHQGEAQEEARASQVASQAKAHLLEGLQAP